MTYPSAPEPDPTRQPAPPPYQPYEPYPPQPPVSPQPPFSAQPPVSGQPPVYGQPGPPQYAAPYSENPYGQPNPYAQGPYAQPPQPQTTNGFAIASLIFGILGGILFGVVFGIVALVQIPKRNQKGKGMAVTGLVLSIAWLLVCGAGLAIGALSEDDSNGPSSLLPSMPSAAKELKVGDCINGLLALDLDKELRRNPPAVSCAEPHEGEVFRVVKVTGTSFPGTTEIENQAEAGCSGEALSAYAPDDKTQDLSIYYLYPTSSSWTFGDRDITCLVVNEKDKLTGSLRR